MNATRAFVALGLANIYMARGIASAASAMHTTMLSAVSISIFSVSVPTQQNKRMSTAPAHL